MSNFAFLRRGMLRASALVVGSLLAAAPAAALDLPAAAARADGNGLKPGLSVVYVYEFVRHIDDIGDWDDAEPGDPLPQLDYRSGEGEVLTSGENNGVCAAIKGFIRFNKAGTWTLKVTSNDGVRVRLVDTQIHEDPDVHGDRDSKPIKVSVARDGWYPLDIQYFERKGTSTLRLWWTPPGGDGYTIVPAAALSHQGS